MKAEILEALNDLERQTDKLVKVTSDALIAARVFCSYCGNYSRRGGSRVDTTVNVMRKGPGCVFETKKELKCE